MTIKEIEKIIDESDCYWLKRGDWKLLCTLNHEWTKGDLKRQVMCTIGNGYSYVFMRLNDNGEVESRWLVDHIDKEKKIIKKKLDDMTDEEIKHIEEEFCGNVPCDECPLWTKEKYWCGAFFPSFRKQYLEYKDQEIEVEE